MIRVDWRPALESGARPPTDFGVGVVFFRRQPGGPERTIDSLAVYSDTTARRAVTGYFLLDQQPAGAYVYAVAAPRRLSPNVLEYDYEIAGLPLDARPRGRWVRAVLGFDEARRPYRVWVRLDSALVGHLLWSEHLPRQSLFFLSQRTAELFDYPGGSRVVFPLGPGHSMQPVAVRGPWMEVRIEQGVCGEMPPDTLGQAWIRYLDARGRPLVWYHTRGC